MTTVTFTKHFVPGSILEGLTYPETVEFAPINGLDTQKRVNDFVSFLKKHTTKPVKACAGSNYTVSDIEVL